MESRFSTVQDAPPIEVFALSEQFNNDTFKDKVSLGVGAYRTNEGKPWVLPVVTKAEQMMAADRSLNHEYLPITGGVEFVKESCKLLLGEDSKPLLEGRVDGCQGLGGTGSIFVGASFLYQLLGYRNWYISKPTWGNHKGIGQMVGYTVHEYRYWNEAGRNLDLEGMLEDLRAAPENSVVVLHACAHNPTGVDPTQEQWQQIATVVREKNLFPYFDIAYQGFSSGDLDKDAWAVRYFVNELGFEALIAQSFSKNFGLYNERIGNLCYVSNDANTMARMKSQIKLIVRKVYSNPPNHGSRVVATVLSNNSMRAEWKEHVDVMASRIRAMRESLHERLKKLGTPGNWDHIISQTGMFSYTGLTLGQVEYLKTKYHIYMLKSGRINMCGLRDGNLDYVANAFDDAVRHVK